ncbi:MAG TPA: HAD family phosphatase [Leeuwenhoekiella sp.]|nr:HAD family phosphatase [Leeuwenhoekiella sp.]
MIENIIFDFGDVFIDLDKKAPTEYFSRFDIHEIDDEMKQWNINYEMGQLSTNAFIEHYLHRFPRLNHISFSTAWNSMIQYFPQQRLDWIKELSKSRKYRLFLLSNTNDLHIEQVMKNMDKSRFIQFKSAFEGFYLSQDLKLRKPNPEIFEHVLKENGLKPQKTLFIDDVPENTQVVEKLSMHTWNIKPGKEDITQLFSIKKELF